MVSSSIVRSAPAIHAVGLLAMVSVTATLTAANAAEASVPLEASTQRADALGPGEARVYTLQLERGASAEVAVRQQGVDVVLEVLDPGGKVLDAVDGPTGRTGDEVAEVVASEAGSYRFRVRPIDSREPAGTIVVEVRAFRSPERTGTLLLERRARREDAAAWIRARSSPLPLLDAPTGTPGVRALDRLAAQARVLALGEATHGSRELSDLRVRLTQHLVARRGYRLLALEASATALDELTPWVQAEQELTPATSSLLASGWIGRRARRGLLEWVRSWNRTHPGDRIRVVGIDAQENAGARKTLGDLLRAAYGEPMLQRWAAAERDLAAADEQSPVFGDSGVDPATRTFLLEVVALLDLDAPVLERRIGSRTLDAARTAARTLAEFADFNAGSRPGGTHSRDWFMASRVLRALDTRGARTRAVVWAHNAHVMHRPDSDRTAGDVLRRALGCGYVALATTFDQGAFLAQVPNDPQDRLTVSTLPPARDETVEGMLRSVRPGGVVATWDCPLAGQEVRALPTWLRTPHPMRWVGALWQPGTIPTAAFRDFDLLRDFDGVAMVPRVTAEADPGDRPVVPLRVRH
jgi:erythromycin esterase